MGIDSNNLEPASWRSRANAAVLDGMYSAGAGVCISLVLTLIYLAFKNMEMGGLVLIVTIIINAILLFFTSMFGFSVPIIGAIVLLYPFNMNLSDQQNSLHRTNLIDIMGVLLVFPGIMPLLVSFFYQVLMESSPLQATPGKLLVGLAIVNKKGQTISPTRAIVRYFLKGLSPLFLGIPQLVLLFGAKQTLYDKVSGCMVIKKHPN